MGASVFAGRYRLESLLGQSAMAEVWLAYDLELERPVALKLLTPEADRTRFEREARAAASLSHPNVTRVYDYGEDAGRPYMALEYLPGGTLETRLAHGRRLQDAETAAIAAQLAAGLAHAHEHGLVHRDVKPANVLFDDEGRPKLADFGIARAADASAITEAGTIIGTAAYISPEQAGGEPATPASDVYSFGVLLYRMLTGRLPFESDSPLELARMHQEVESPALAIVRPDAPPGLGQLAMDALAKDPRRRPPDGAALAARLETPPDDAQAAGAETVVIPRTRRRRRVPLIPLLLGGLALLAAAGIAAGILVTRNGSGAAPPTSVQSTHPASTSSAPSIASTTEPSTTSPSTSTTPPAPTTAPATTAISPPPSTVIPSVTIPSTIGTTTTIGG